MTTIYSFLKRRALNHLPESILAPIRQWHYARVLRSINDAEEPDLKVVRALVQWGSTAVDLGANIGIYTKTLSELVGPKGTVISVEPVPMTFEVLSQNVRSLLMTNVSCVNAAISGTDGHALMELPSYDTGGLNFYEARVVAEDDPLVVDPKNHFRVRTAKLDTLLRGLERICFVKCDVEGYELACLSGAEEILASHGPAWLVEVSGDPDEEGSNAKLVFQVFDDRGYTPWWFDKTKLRRRRQGDRSTNYFFLTPAHVTSLVAKAPNLTEN